MGNGNPVAQTTAEAYVMVKPDEALPSGDPRYVSLDAVRGTRNVAQSLTERVAAYESTAAKESSPHYACFLVTGHSGCGKTTELYRLRKSLENNNHAVVYFDAEEEMNLQTLNWWNVLLEMIWQIDE